MSLQVTFYYFLSSSLQQWLHHYLNSVLSVSASSTKTADEEMSHSDPTPPALASRAGFTAYVFRSLKSLEPTVGLIFANQPLGNQLFKPVLSLAFLLPFP